MLMTALCLPLAALAISACGATQAEIAKKKSDSDFHYKLAYGYLFDPKPENRNVGLALAEAERALVDDANSADALFLVALIRMGRDEHLEAARHYERAIALRPDFHFARNNLGTCYLALERWDDAIAVFTDLTSNPYYTTPGNAQNNLGWAYYRKGDLAKALQHFTVARQLNAELCPAYNNLGLVHLDESRLDKAEREFSEAVRRCPGYAEPYFHLGRVHARRAEREPARQSFQRCVQLSGTTPLADRCERQLAALTAGEGSVQ